MTARESAGALLNVWSSIFASGAAASTYYRRVSGFSSPLRYAVFDLTALAEIMLWATAVALVDRLLSRRFEERAQVRTVYRICLAILGLLSLRSTVWYYLPRAFPILIAGAAAYYLYRAKGGPEGRDRERSTVLAGFAAFAFVMLLKTILATRLYHYGFVLAFPATMLLAVVMLETVPKALRRAYGGGAMFREAAYSAIAAFSAFYMAMSVTSYQERSLEIETPRGRVLWWDPSFSTAGIGFSEAVDLLSAHAQDGATLVSLPDAAGINYVTGLVNPTPYISIVPPELAAFGEETVLAALRNGCPDYILVSHRWLAGYGMGRFALDAPLAPKILRWVRSGYEQIGSVDPRIRKELLDQTFTLYRRKQDADPRQPAWSTEVEQSSPRATIRC